MTTSELDRLVSKTMLTPVAKQALREVRFGIMSGRVGDPNVGEADWSIGITSRGGSNISFRFSFKKAK